MRRLSTVSFVIFKGELTEVRSHVNGEKKKLEEGLKQQLKEHNLTLGNIKLVTSLMSEEPWA